ncbi:MAG: YifB family Mg chelatase-like AAA ATPase [Eubacteriales bacterium]|nr:YifB family Mg chelatase-like AAA ATPase [Eubacteriales bacterium]
MVSKVNTCTLSGVDGLLIEVESFIARGLPAFDIVGLPSVAVKESKDRVRAALLTGGFRMPPARITVNLSPADVKKEGSGFDLPIAIALLQESGQMHCKSLHSTLLLGELSLSGEILPIHGCLPMVICALQKGICEMIVPYGNANELNCLQGAKVYPAKNLREVVGHLQGTERIAELQQKNYEELLAQSPIQNDLKYVRGQYMARAALELAAAGGHNLLMVGVPGSGKTMLARCLPSILPSMSYQEALETTKIHSSAGELTAGSGLLCERPFRAPHHSASQAAIIGGGRLAKPGEISLAHNGVLFLDEFPEYDRKIIEALRQPLEDGIVSIARVGAREQYPANIMLIASMNPCPCGNYGSKTKECTCSKQAIQNYLARISGPMLDRMDIQVEMDTVSIGEIESSTKAESSAEVRIRVMRARLIQQKRYANLPIHCNAQLTAQTMEEFCPLTAPCKKLLAGAVERYGMSLRSYGRVRKLARTLADLQESENILPEHIIKALQFRNLESKFWG